MSYISDALRKARNEKGKGQGEVKIKKSLWATLTGTVASDGKKNDSWQKWYTVIGLSIAVCYAAGILIAIHWSDIRPKLFASREGRLPAPVAAAPISFPGQQTNVPVPPQTAPPAEQAQVVNARVAAETVPPQAPMVKAAEEAKTPDIKEIKPLKKADLPEEAAAADTKSLYAQALQKQRTGKLDEAKELYKEVIKNEPRNIQALNNLGVVYLKMKRYKWAAARLHDAISIKHDYVDAHYNLACLYAQKSDTKKSLFYLRNAVELNPEARSWAAQDHDFKDMANTAEFKNLVRAQDN